MKQNKIWLAVLAIILIIGQAAPVLASNTVLTLDASAKDFAKIENNEDFQNMEPGETREAKIQLQNDSGSEMSFYISGEILNNLADAADAEQWAIYDLRLYKNSETEPFFTGTVGSAKNKELDKSDMGLNYLKDDTLLVTLKDGEAAAIRVEIQLDGDSAGNAYMNKEGEIQLNLSASAPTANNPGTVITTNTKTEKNIIQKLLTVKTGDNMPIGITIASFIAAIAVITAVLAKRKHTKKGE